MKEREITIKLKMSERDYKQYYSDELVTILTNIFQALLLNWLDRYEEFAIRSGITKEFDDAPPLIKKIFDNIRNGSSLSKECRNNKEELLKLARSKKTGGDNPFANFDFIKEK